VADQAVEVAHTAVAVEPVVIADLAVQVELRQVDLVVAVVVAVLAVKTLLHLHSMVVVVVLAYMG
jgi:hypothetical protein